MRNLLQRFDQKVQRLVREYEQEISEQRTRVGHVESAKQFAAAVSQIKEQYFSRTGFLKLPGLVSGYLYHLHQEGSTTLSTKIINALKETHIESEELARSNSGSGNQSNLYELLHHLVKQDAFKPFFQLSAANIAVVRRHHVVKYATGARHDASRLFGRLGRKVMSVVRKPSGSEQPSKVKLWISPTTDMVMALRANLRADVDKMLAEKVAAVRKGDELAQFDDDPFLGAERTGAAKVLHNVRKAVATNAEVVKLHVVRPDDVTMVRYALYPFPLSAPDGVTNVLADGKVVGEMMKMLTSLSPVFQQSAGDGDELGHRSTSPSFGGEIDGEV